MHVPTITDEMLDKVLDRAASPVAVLFFAGEPERIRMVSARFEKVAEEHDDRIIFLRISVEENPTPSLVWARHLMEIVVFRQGVVQGRLSGEFTTDTIGRLIEAVRAQLE